MDPEVLEAQTHEDKPPGGTAPKRDKVNPVIACAGNPERFAALKRGLRAWRRAYREAWAKWAAGLREVVFPRGTFYMQVCHSVCCGPAP